MVKSTITKTPPPLHGIKQEVIKSIDYTFFRNRWYFNALHPKTDFENVMSDLDKELLGVPKITGEEMGKMVSSYLQGIGWVNTYYNQGTYSINIKWFYSWEYAPLFMDIFSSTKDDPNVPPPPPYIRQPQQTYYNTVWQLLSILPKASQDLLPIEVRYLMNTNSPISDLYPTNFLVEKKGINAEWQGIALLPPFNPERVVKTINNNVKFSIIRQQQFGEGAALILEGTGGSRFVTRRKIGANQYDRDRRGRRGGFGGRGGFRRQEFRGRGGRRQEFRGRGGFVDRGRRQEFRGRGGFVDRGRRQEFRGRGFVDRGRRQEFRGRGFVDRGRRRQEFRRDDVRLRRQPLEKTLISRVVKPIRSVSGFVPSGMVSRPPGITSEGRVGRVGKTVSSGSFASVLFPSAVQVQSSSTQQGIIPSSRVGRIGKSVASGSFGSVLFPSAAQTQPSSAPPRTGRHSPFTLNPNPATTTSMTASNLSFLRQPDRTRTERRLTAHHSRTPQSTTTQRRTEDRFTPPHRQYKPSKGQKQKIQNWNDQEKLM